MRLLVHKIKHILKCLVDCSQCCAFSKFGSWKKKVRRRKYKLARFSYYITGSVKDALNSTIPNCINLL